MTVRRTRGRRASGPTIPTWTTHAPVRPLLLDLFCGAGGAAAGYYAAGFDVLGVDIKPQPRYPFGFIQADALVFMQQWNDVPGQRVKWGDFDAIHASPPCQGYTPMTNRHPSSEPRLIPEVRFLLRLSGRPYVIENVPGAPLENGAWVCGKALGLTTRRHRRFESSLALFSTDHGPHGENDVAVYGSPDGRRLFTRADGSELRAWASLEEGRTALGVPWMEDADEIREAIPPAYTEFIGNQLMVFMRRGADDNLGAM
jgi:DNA (cytosine-5)-methyltransferase 1